MDTMVHTWPVPYTKVPNIKSNSHVQKYSAYPQSLCSVLTVNNDNFVNDFTEHLIILRSTSSCYSLDCPVPELKHAASVPNQADLTREVISN